MLVMSDIYKLYSSLPEPFAPGKRTVAEISIPALLNNYKKLLGAARRTNPQTRPVCVVKADAYGHGADRVAAALMGAGCDFFAVSCIEEAAALRRSLGGTPDIIILGYTPPECAGILAGLNVIQTLYSEPYARAVADFARNAGVRIRAHLKLDTGMNRLGIAAQSDGQIKTAAEITARLARTPEILLEGIFTHFARADEEEGCVDSFTAAATSASPAKTRAASFDGAAQNAQLPALAECGLPGELLLPASDAELTGADFTILQYERFVAVCKLLGERGISIPCRHVSNSAVSVRRPDLSLECVRFGIMLYGLSASDNVVFPGLLPVMKLRSVISHIHTVSPGSSVGYGGCFTSNIPTKIATIPVGYADGFLRAYTGGTIRVRHGNTDYDIPIVGRICMDQLTADVSSTPAEPGDSVILFGDSAGSLEALARRAGTIAYESACIISSRVPRYYV